MSTKSTFRGFSLIEVVVVVAILVIMASISTVALQNFSRSSALKVATQEVYTALTSARTDTLASLGDVVFGVHMSTTSVTRFTGSTYTAGDSSNTVYAFEGGVTATSSLIGGGGNIVFARLTGKPSATGTIWIRSINGDATTTVSINASGLIEY